MAFRIAARVCTTAVILVTYYYAADALPIDKDRPVGGQLMVLIVSGYAFKFAVALLDTLPFYVGVHYLSRYLRINTRESGAAGRET